MTELLLNGLAAWRLARLVVEDAFPPSELLREKVKSFFGVDSAPAYLVSCMACSSVWTAAGVVAAVAVAPRWARPVRQVLAVSALALLIEGRADGG